MYSGTSLKGHSEYRKQFISPLYKGQVLWSLQDHGNTISPLKKDNPCITAKLASPKVSIHPSSKLLYNAHHGIRTPLHLLHCLLA